MKNLQLPSQYALLTEDEQRAASGGGEFRDALNEFFGNLHLSDFTMGGGLISFSITFVPMLLVSAVKSGVSFGIQVYNELVKLFGFQPSTSTSETIQALAAAQPQEKQDTGTYRPMF